MKNKVLKCFEDLKGCCFVLLYCLLEDFEMMPRNKLQTQDPSGHWVAFKEQPFLDVLVNIILIFYFMICQQKLNQVFNISQSICQTWG